MDKNPINAVEMVRAIRDQMYEETKHMSPEEFLEYIHREAALADAEAENVPQSARPAA
jgi:protein-disulfide isomerase-like protein with CxxC motif